MQSNISNEQFSGSYSSPSEPHFDDEATLLSARPVVPIGELSSKTGLSRPLVFGLAVAGALLLGVSATVFYYSRFSTVEGQSVTRIETVASDVQGVASEPPNLSELPGATGTIESDDFFAESNKSTKAKTQVSSRPVTTRALNSSRDRLKKPAHRPETRVVDQRSDYDYETRDERHAARRESRERKGEIRARRAARRLNEVLRIREIFEGPARP
jgi:hypothetical protein